MFLKVYIFCYFQTKTQSVCHDLKDKKFDGKNGILAVGLISKHLVLVTLSFHVFMVPRYSLDGAFNKLYLGNKAELMSEIWPNMWSNVEFENARNGHIFNAFMVRDRKSDFFCVTTKQELYDNVGACYDIINKVAFPGYTYTGHDDNVVLSANEPIIYYVMHKVKENLQLCQFRFKGPQLWVGFGVVTIEESSPWRSLCRNGDSIYSSDKLCDKPYMMPVLKGFQDEDMFYLFGESYITIFTVKVFTQPEKQFPVVQKSYSQFIFCEKANVSDRKLHQGNGQVILDSSFEILDFFKVPVWP